MKVAALSDVHANLPALEAVLRDARSAEAGVFWNLGDFVGYGPFPDQVVRLLRETARSSIIGNYDLKVLDFEKKRDRWRRSKAPAKFLAFQWAFENLSAESLDYLASLPEKLTLEVEGLRSLLVHGSPAANDEPLDDATPEARLEELARMAEADLVLCGHSHKAFDRTAGGVRFVNPGSIGRPAGEDPRAEYALLTFEEGNVRVERRRIEYDVQRAVAALEAYGLPDDYRRVLTAGAELKGPSAGRRGIDRVRPEPDPADAERLEPVLRLAERCEYERGHTHQVTRLALALFDELRDLHGLGPAERFWLHCASLLHDIGWTEGRKKHHKTAMRLILEDVDLPFGESERRLVALIARYHRRALPKDKHELFGDLDPADKHRVRMLGGLLRAADGLDRGHANAVEDVSCRVEPTQLVIACRAAGDASQEQAAFESKSDLLREAVGRKVSAVFTPEGRKEREP